MEPGKNALSERPDRILFVDDDETVRLMAERALEIMSIPFDVIADGGDAWRSFDQHRQTIVFTDLHLPTLSGEDLLRRIKSEAPETDIVVVTGFPTLRSAIKTFKDGACDYLLKPIDAGDLHRVVERCLETRRLRHELTTEKQMRRRLEEVYELKTHFLANVSHELRTPLHVILGYGDLLAADLEGSEQESDLTRLMDSARGLAGIVENLLLLTNIDAGACSVNAADTDLGQLILDAVEDRSDGVAGPVYKVEIEAELGIVRADPDLMRRLVGLLLDNSRKFTETGHIWVRVAAVGRGVTLEVSDTGKGIPEEILGTIFEDFRQGDSSATRRAGGMGIGLALAKRLVSLLDGSISAANRPAGGAIFQVSLPNLLEHLPESKDVTGGRKQ